MVPDTLCSLLADKVKRGCPLVLLVIAAILTVIIVGLWIALAVLIYSKWTTVSKFMGVLVHLH